MPLINPEHAYREFVPTLAPGEAFSEHHIKVRREELSRYVLIPGSHLRGRLIAEQMADCRVVSATRGYYLYTGFHNGQRLTVCSTGMGGPAAAIAMEELGAMGCDTFLRVGSAGAVAPGLGVGDIAVATGCVRGGGTANRYLPLEFPAVPDFSLTAALAEAGRAAGLGLHFGVCATGDAFYAPDPEAESGLLRRSGVLAIEMEADTLFVVAQYRGWRAAAAFVLDGGDAREVGESSSGHMQIADHATHRTFKEGEMALIRLSLDALAEVARREAR
ncbi:MAG TPA: nucleoside phosphorylase [Symbiobacteriaceae bacterium]|nr:nucleoside phosphorylase [Symbiobacteriaceae bacterium]